MSPSLVTRLFWFSTWVTSEQILGIYQDYWRSVWAAWQWREVRLMGSERKERGHAESGREQHSRLYKSMSTPARSRLVSEVGSWSEPCIPFREKHPRATGIDPWKGVSAHETKKKLVDKTLLLLNNLTSISQCNICTCPYRINIWVAGNVVWSGWL